MSDDGKAPEDAPEVVVGETLMGFEFLKDMSREALIEEIIAEQRRQMAETDINNLRANVIEIRVTLYKKRLVDEAGLELHNGPFGQHYATKDDDEDSGNE